MSASSRPPLPLQQAVTKLRKAKTQTKSFLWPKASLGNPVMLAPGRTTPVLKGVCAVIQKGVCYGYQTEHTGDVGSIMIHT